MTTKNDITGDTLATKETTDAYRDGYDRIWGKKPESLQEEKEMIAVAVLRKHFDSSLCDSEETE